MVVGILLDKPDFASPAWLVIELCWKDDGICIALFGINTLHIVYVRDKISSLRLLDRICTHY